MVSNYIMVVAIAPTKVESRLFKKGDAIDEVFGDAIEAIDGVEFESVSMRHPRDESIREERTYYYRFDEIGRDEEDLMRYYGYRKCDGCGKWLTPQQVRDESTYMGNGIRYCGLCYANRMAQDHQSAKPTIHCYHDSRDEEVIYYFGAFGKRAVRADDIGVGIEMEFDGRSVERDECEFLKSFKKEVDNGEWRFENDGSLDNGFECISNVWSIATVKSKDFKPLARQLQEWGADDEYYSSGFHIHISCGILGDDPEDQKENMLKLKCFLKEYWGDFVKMSGRDEDRMAYCSCPTQSQLESNARDLGCSYKDMMDIYRVSHGSQGCALICDGPTIEWRIFKSSSNAERISMIINFVIDLSANIGSVKWEDIYVLRKVLLNQDEAVLRYWRNNGCFCRSHAVDGKKGEEVRLGY